MDRKIRVAAIGDNCIDYYDSLNESYPGGNPVNVAVSVSYTHLDVYKRQAFIFGTNATRKTTKCNSFHYCAASHSAVNCLIVC